jgi:GNAT superfamily N-acetyltransferase
MIDNKKKIYLTALSLMVYGLIMSVSVGHASGTLGESEARCRISPFTSADTRHVVKICLKHAESVEKDFLDIKFTNVLKLHKTMEKARSAGQMDDIFGYYGLYYTDTEDEVEKMVGLISIMMDCRISRNTNGYAECQMVMHPHFRGKKLGSTFRKKFNETIVEPKVGTTVKFLLSGKPVEAEFYGAKGFVHVDNMASRKVLTKVGYVPLELSFTPYQETGEPVAQIVYVYPYSHKRPRQLEEHIVRMILENTAAHRGAIIETAQARQRVLDLTADLIEGARGVFGRTNSFKEVYSFMKIRAFEQSKPFPEEEFNQFVGGQKMHLQEIGKWSEAYDAELGGIFLKNMSDFPSKYKDVQPALLMMMRAMGRK